MQYVHLHHQHCNNHHLYITQPHWQNNNIKLVRYYSKSNQHQSTTQCTTTSDCFVSTNSNSQCLTSTYERLAITQRQLYTQTDISIFLH